MRPMQSNYNKAADNSNCDHIKQLTLVKTFAYC